MGLVVFLQKIDMIVAKTPHFFKNYRIFTIFKTGT